MYRVARIPTFHGQPINDRCVDETDRRVAGLAINGSIPVEDGSPSSEPGDDGFCLHYDVGTIDG
eukprot:scaffold8013_cov139-Amphora_coffeaeformis.AAC.6